VSVAVYDNGAYPRPWIALMAPAVELAKAVAGTDFVPKAMRHEPAKVTAAILYGDEVGLGPMQSLAKINVIEGKPSLAAEAQRALIFAAGHDMWLEELTVTKCTWAGRRSNSDQTSRVTWSLDDARRAGLAGRPSWRAYPRQMLSARASAELARAIFADAIGGLAATEELEDVVGSGDAGDEGSPPDPATTRRQRRRLPTAAVSTGEPPAPDNPQPPLPGEEGEAVMSEAQRRKMQALFRDHDITDRAERLAYASHIIGRDVETSNQLTADEAQHVIEALDARRGEASGTGAGQSASAPPAEARLAGPDQPAELPLETD
jgi:hypothetical protein